MHSLNPKCIEMCSLIENALHNLLTVPFNYFQIHLKMFYIKLVISHLHMEVCETRRVKMCSLKNPGEIPDMRKSTSWYWFIL